MSGPIRWFVDNPIAANLLMIFLLIGGVLALPALDKQFFPDFELNMVSVTMPYRGAGPSEVEEQICVRIEEAVHDLSGVKEIRSTARQGLGTVIIEAETGYDMQRLTAEVKTRVDAVTSFPVDAERPIVTELAHRHHMAVVTVAGELGERSLKELAERLRDDLSAQPHVSVVELRSPRPYEVSIEVSEYTLRRYGLKFADVVNAIRGSSLNLPAGTIKAADGDIQLQTRGQAYERQDFEQIPLLSTRDGTRIRLGDVATIQDGFEDVDVRTRFNDKPSHNMHVYVTADPNALETSDTVIAWAERTRANLPPGVELAVWRDTSVPFNERMNTLVRNGMGGLVLVFLVLMLFLRPMLAVWVCSGIGVAFMGTFFVLQYTGVSLNMMSLFAFLLILGIVVDDAIIVAESIYSRQVLGEMGARGAVTGAQMVVKPVMFAVISTMIFFAPMMFLPGDMASAAAPIPVVVILALLFSLIECFCILPAHLAHMRPPKPVRFAWLQALENFRQRFGTAMTRFARDVFRPFMAYCLSRNLLVIALFMVAHTRQILLQVEGAALQAKEEFNLDPRYQGLGAVVGNIDSMAQENEVRVMMETRSGVVDTRELSSRWRELIGDPGEVESFDLDYTINDRGKPINLVLASASLAELRAVSAELRQLLAAYPGVYNITDSLQSPREEMVLGLRPAAENLSVNLADLARQVREAFYGAEAQRIPRTREDVRVMVRYPEQERVSPDNLRDMRVRTPAGDEVPFDTVAEVTYQPGYLTIDRLDRKRTLEVSAEVAAGTSVPRAVVEDIVARHYPDWQQRFPGLSLRLDGELQEETEFTEALFAFMGLAMLLIYALMAVAFRSYGQPLLVLTAVPFGIMGAIFGHMILDWEISMLSLMGVIACAGVVVNDNLVLIDRINQLRAGGHAVVESLLQGGEDRFRPIILTSLTTFVGLLPIMSETSMQAQFLIPMVISLAFGVLFATGVTLLLVPCLYLLGAQLSAHVLHRRQSLPDAIDGV